MSSIDPFAAPITKTIPGMQGNLVNAYPVGFFKPVQHFDVGRMLTAPFKSPNWGMNLVWMLICELCAIFIIGRIVAFGYLAEVAESRSGGKSEHWPDFTPERFNEYLQRGLWPFLWNIIWAIPMMIGVGVPLMITGAMSKYLDQNGSAGPATLVGLVGISVCIFLFFGLLLAMFASMLHSALGNDFMKGADLVWIGSFLTKVGGTSILAFIMYALVGIGSMIFGALLLCVGIFFAAPFMYLLGADLAAQLHDIFVTRGGVPAFQILEGDEEIVEAQVVL
jgi:hypothetical protein